MASLKMAFQVVVAVWTEPEGGEDITDEKTRFFLSFQVQSDRVLATVVRHPKIDINSALRLRIFFSRVLRGGAFLLLL